MHDPIGWAMVMMAMAAAESPQPGLSRPRIVAERSSVGACRADDASDDGPLDVAVTVRNAGDAPTAHLIAWPLAAPGAIGPAGARGLRGDRARRRAPRAPSASRATIRAAVRRTSRWG